MRTRLYKLSERKPLQKFFCELSIVFFFTFDERKQNLKSGIEILKIEESLM